MCFLLVSLRKKKSFEKIGGCEEQKVIFSKQQQAVLIQENQSMILTTPKYHILKPIQVIT